MSAGDDWDKIEVLSDRARKKGFAGTQDRERSEKKVLTGTKDFMASVVRVWMLAKIFSRNDRRNFCTGRELGEGSEEEEKLGRGERTRLDVWGEKIYRHFCLLLAPRKNIWCTVLAQLIHVLIHFYALINHCGSHKILATFRIRQSRENGRGQIFVMDAVRRTKQWRALCKVFGPLVKIFLRTCFQPISLSVLFKDVGRSLNGCPPLFRFFQKYPTNFEIFFLLPKRFSPGITFVHLSFSLQL